PGTVAQHRAPAHRVLAQIASRPTVEAQRMERLRIHRAPASVRSQPGRAPTAQGVVSLWAMRDSRHGVAARTVPAPGKVIALHSLLDSGTQASVAHGIAPLEVARPAIAEHANGRHGRRGMVV